MTFHFPEEVATNLLTIDATDPVSGTAEFKAAAIRIEPLGRLADPPPPAPQEISELVGKG
jgi:formate dehydrogenase major subunit